LCIIALSDHYTVNLYDLELNFIYEIFRFTQNNICYKIVSSEQDIVEIYFENDTNGYNYMLYNITEKREIPKFNNEGFEYIIEHIIWYENDEYIIIVNYSNQFFKLFNFKHECISLIDIIHDCQINIVNSVIKNNNFLLIQCAFNGCIFLMDLRKDNIEESTKIPIDIIYISTSISFI
jgi:hypothetical protein